VKAVRIHEDGGPEVLRYEDVEDPAAGPGEVLVRLKAAALNHLDIWIRQGLPSVPKPRILGADGAGVIAGLGEGSDTFSEGDAVVINPGLADGAKIIGEHCDGTHAELIAVPAENVYRKPDSLSFEEAAAFPLVFETAYRMLVTKARLAAGEWVLVWGIGSGVATATFQIAKAVGARTIVTSSSDEKLERARELGAEATVNHASGDVTAAVREATGGHGADVIVEHVGEDTWKTSLQVAAPAARIAVCGATSGPTPPAHRQGRPRHSRVAGADTPANTAAQPWQRGARPVGSGDPLACVFACETDAWGLGLGGGHEAPAPPSLSLSPNRTRG
jgi:NADPH:quinone reductase-like Zn-dependent oxidoreductase